MNISVVHQKSDIAREQDNLADALTLINEALTEYKKNENFAGYVMAQLSRSLIHKHEFLKTRNNDYAVNARKDAEGGLAIAQDKKLNEYVGVCYFRLGEAFMLIEDYESAVKNYELALDNFYGTLCERGDYRYHYGEALFKAGRKGEGKRIMLTGLEEIQNNRSDVDSFLANVWESGCYMRLAQLLKREKSRQAATYLEKARSIIDSDPRLIIRKRQLYEMSNM